MSLFKDGIYDEEELKGCAILCYILFAAIIAIIIVTVINL